MCRCGAEVPTAPGRAVDARVQRCGACGALLSEGAERCDYCKAEVVRDAAALALLCPECFAGNAEQARFCTCCGVAFRPEPLPGEEDEPLPCPGCHQAMQPRGIGGIWLLACGKCGGLWVPDQRLDELVRRVLETWRGGGGRDTDSVAARSFERDFSYRQCPACSQSMQRKNFGQRSGVIVDWCGAHGAFLDANELEQIAAFVLAGGLREDASGVPGLSRAGRMNAEQAQALLAAEFGQDKMRRRAETLGERGSWLIEFLTTLLH